MKRLILLLNIIIFTITSLFAQQKTALSAENPNIIFILADDLGYESVNSYGADKELLRTPHIDKIAEEGIRFTNAHTPASICTPTRYGLLMGEYPWRSSLKFGVVNPMDPLLPDPEQVTLADVLKDQGYNTAVIGKWHLGYGNNQPVNWTGKLSPGPLDMGFDYHFGVPQNHGDKIGVYIENDHVFGIISDKVQPYSRTYYGSPYIGLDAPQRVNKNVMEVLTNEAINWLKRQSTDKPFFLYFAPVAVHDPITPSDYMRGVSDCGPYGDFIQDLDLSVGKIMATLEYLGLTDNTLIFFSSDNGGDIPHNPQKPHQQAIKKGLRINGAFRGDKHTIWEGGTRVPFMVSWPGQIKGGLVSDQMINMVDVFATVVALTNVKTPEGSNMAPDSFSFLSALKDHANQIKVRPSMVTADLYGIQAIRKGNWKYIDNMIPDNLPERWLKRLDPPIKPQLYNLAKDPGEENDLYDKNTEIAKELLQELNRIRGSVSSSQGSN